MALDINELVRWEREELHEVPSLWARALDFLSIGPGLSVRRDAKVNMLKFLQTETVKQYELAYDNLYFELGGGLECLRQIDSFAPLEDSGLFQKELDMQSLGADAKQEKQLQAYLADASAATCRLHDLVREIEKDVDGCVGKYPVVKRLDRTKCKADKSCGGDVRKVTDMARVAVVCDKPEDLVQAYRTLMERLKVVCGLSSTLELSSVYVVYTPEYAFVLFSARLKINAYPTPSGYCPSSARSWPLTVDTPMLGFLDDSFCSPNVFCA